MLLKHEIIVVDHYYIIGNSVGSDKKRTHHLLLELLFQKLCSW